MSKENRIPEAWPIQMSDAMAARYCDMSLSQFRSLVAQGKLPPGRKIFGTSMIRWLRRSIDNAIEAAHGDNRRRGKSPREIELDREFGID